MSNLKKTILAALLVAVGVVLARFISIKTPIITISFTFVVNMLSGMLLGPVWSIFVCGLIDLIGALLFPFGAYFFGYTFSAMLSGLIYGLLLYKKKPISRKKFLIRLVISSLLVIIICNSVLNTIWVYIQTKKAAMAILPARLLKQLIMLPIHIVVMFFLDMGLEKMGIYKKYIYINNLDQNKENEQENKQNDDGLAPNVVANGNKGNDQIVSGDAADDK